MSTYHILIVDDQKDIRRVLVSGLQTLGQALDVIEVPSAEEAMLLAPRRTFDLIVTDVRLPGISGLDLVKKLRAFNPNLKLILITGLSDHQTRKQVEEAGTFAFFYKPIEMGDFLDAVERALGLVETSFAPAPLALEPPKQQAAPAPHVGSRSGRFLRRVVARVNRLEADGVLITGDLIDFADISERELGSLGELRFPTYFIIGNHERYVDVDAICARLTNLGIRVLRNESIEVGHFQLVGIDDAEPKTQVGRTLRICHRWRIATGSCSYHRPDGARDAADWGAHLMLCGHTHNGQIVPFNYVVRRVFPRICGLYRIDDLHLYVSQSTGTWGPILRLGSRCEIGLIQLT